MLIMADAQKVVRAVESCDIIGNHSIFNVIDMNTPRYFVPMSEEYRNYLLSKPVHAIDCFISHSWRTCGFDKKLVLAFFLHSRVAALVSFLFLFTSSAIVYNRFSGTPTLCQQRTTDEWLIDCVWSGGVVIGTGLSFLLTLRFGQHLPFTGLTFFMDKVCIHQGDHELKSRAMQSLDIFLLYSRRMLVMWAPDYFNRLWCVYELATYLKLHPDGMKRVVFLPTWMPRFAFLTTIVLGVQMPILGMVNTGPLLAWGMRVAGPFWGWILVHNLAVVVPAATAGGYMCYTKARRHAYMIEQMRHFDTNTAMCQEESDKLFLLDLIELMWRSSEGTRDGIQQFEHFVRETLPVQLISVVGTRTAIPYHFLVISYLCMIHVHFMFGLMCDEHMVQNWGYASAYPDVHDRYRAFVADWLLYCGINCFLSNSLANSVTLHVCARIMDAKMSPFLCGMLTCVVYSVCLLSGIFSILVFVMWEPGSEDILHRRVSLVAVLGMTCYLVRRSD